ncbi:MAG: hypothetical protein L0241_08500 [Planctomycetia bacterium]|nr:hypothetical protein [Planctomycetia bacterium]
MATKLITVEETYASDEGLHLQPGVLLSWMIAQAELKGLMRGTALELRRPNGSVFRTTLLTCGASVTRGEDGRFYVPGDENGPIWTIVFTLPPEVRPEDVPPGTEVWVESPPAENRGFPDQPSGTLPPEE